MSLATWGSENVGESKRIIRRVAAVSPFGTGAIWEDNRESFVAMDISRWPRDAGTPIELKRLEDDLMVAGFRMPPRQNSRDRKPLPFYRFPEYLFCPACRSLDQYRFDDDQVRPTCQNSKCARTPLVPVRFVKMCADGHISDVDWHWWAHRGAKQSTCQEKHSLAWRELEGGIGLEGLSVECRKCGAKQNLKDIGSIPFKCSGRHPWEKIEKKINCDADVLVTQRGNHNVWTPSLRTALDIPPESNWEPDDDLRELLRENSEFKNLLGQAPGGFFEARQLRGIAARLRIPLEKVTQLLEQERAGSRQESPETQLPLRVGEWRAFLRSESADDRSRFVVEKVDLSSSRKEPGRNATLPWISQISQVVAARRLREVRALRGFSRIKDVGESFKNSTVRMVPCSLDPLVKWLPAVEIYGEGIFLSLNDEEMRKWEAAPEVRARVSGLIGSSVPRLGDVAEPPVSLPRLYLLHTLAHLLIQQLIFDAGYPAASMRERLYVSGADSEDAMCGLLVYTASGDTEGSMGGLVRQAEPSRFVNTFARVLERAQWCSLDPVCSETRSGEAGVNQAACHACSLIPEVSCELRNLYLDRSLIIGSNYSYFR